MTEAAHGKHLVEAALGTDAALVLPAASVVPLEVQRARDRAEEILAAAERDAEAIRATARSQAQEAERRGFDEGLGRWGAMRRALDHERAALAEAVQSVVRASLLALTEHPEFASEALLRVAVERGLRQVDLPAGGFAEVAPEDLDRVRRLLPVGWCVRAKPGIRRGGCRLETPSAEVDATVECAIAAVLHALGDTP